MLNGQHHSLRPNGLKDTGFAKPKENIVHDYAEPLLLLKKMLKEYEETLTAKKWHEARQMGPLLTVQMRMLVQTVRIQSEDLL